MVAQARYMTQPQGCRVIERAGQWLVRQGNMVIGIGFASKENALACKALVDSGVMSPTYEQIARAIAERCPHGKCHWSECCSCIMEREG